MKFYCKQVNARRVLSVLLAVVMVLCAVPVMNIGMKANAYSTPSEVSQATAVSRLHDLVSKLGEGSYFNTTRSTSCGSKSSGHSCSYCFNTNIAKQTWFKNLFGTVSSDQFAYTYSTRGSAGSRAGWSCYGFANFAEWYIFKTSNTDVVDTEYEGTYTLTYSNCSNYVKPGDILRISDSHSVIAYEVSSDGLKAVDCNALGNYNCQVHYRTISYNSSKSFAISRATNSVEDDDLSPASLDDAINIQEGVYSIHSARDENMAVDIQYDSMDSGANIQLYNFLDNNVQKFRIAKSGDYYTVQSVYSGNWLDIKTPIGNRSNVQLFCSKANNEEKWFFEDAGNGYVAIRNYYGYYLDIAGDSAVNNANIQVYNTLESNSQKWRLIPDAPSSSISIPEGVYTIHSAWDKNKVLDIASNSKASGANIQLFDFTASNFDVQRFRVVKSGKYYTIQSVYSNNWLDIATPITHRSNIQLFCLNSNNEEKWFFENAGDGYVNIRNYYGYYVDIAGDSTENHANIQTYRTKYNNSQRWWLVPDNYTIKINANGGTASTSSFSAKYGNKCDLSTSFVQRTGGYKLKGWNLYRPADGKWHVAGVGWKTPEEIIAGGYEKQVYVPNLSMTIDYSWIYSFSGFVSSISSFTFYAVWEECSHTWNSGTVIKEATANEEGTIRYTCTTCGDTKDVSIAALQPTGITVNTSRVKKSYYVGEFLDSSGLKVSATYSDGTTETVTEGFTCTPSELTTPGTQTITVNYAGKTCSYDVNVKVEEPAPYWGDMNGNKQIDDSDAEFITQYLKGYVQLSEEQECFADVDFNGIVNATDSTILLRYAKGLEPIPAASKTAINLITTKSSYDVGDPLESETFQIVVTSTDNTDVSYTIADGFELSGYDPNEVGTQTISTTFRGLELSTTITVVKVEHTHTWNDGTITKAATCASIGEKTFTCTSCGATMIETIAKNASNHTGGTEIRGAKAATCSEEGCTGDVYCNGCGAKLQTSTIIAKTEHTWDEGVVTKEATVSETGEITYTCTVCQTTRIEAIEKLHTPGDINGDNTVNNKDLTRLMKFLAGENVDVVEAALDVNGDGSVNNKDLTRLMKYLAGEDVQIF